MMRQKFPHVTAKKHSGNWAGVGHVANGSGSDPGSTKFHEIEIFQVCDLRMASRSASLTLNLWLSLRLNQTWKAPWLCGTAD